MENFSDRSATNKIHIPMYAIFPMARDALRENCEVEPLPKNPSYTIGVIDSAIGTHIGLNSKVISFYCTRPKLYGYFNQLFGGNINKARWELTNREDVVNAYIKNFQLFRESRLRKYELTRFFYYCKLLMDNEPQEDLERYYSMYKQHQNVDNPKFPKEDLLLPYLIGYLDGGSGTIIVDNSNGGKSKGNAHVGIKTTSENFASSIHDLAEKLMLKSTIKKATSGNGNPLFRWYLNAASSECFLTEYFIPNARFRRQKAFDVLLKVWGNES